MKGKEFKQEKNEFERSSFDKSNMKSKSIYMVWYGIAVKNCQAEFPKMMNRMRN